MPVLLPNTTLTVHVRTHPWVRDEWGVPAPTVQDTVQPVGPYPGSVTERTDGGWDIRLEPAVWPIRAGDRIESADGRVWVANPDPQLHAVPGHPDADYVSVIGTLDPPRVP